MFLDREHNYLKSIIYYEFHFNALSNFANIIAFETII